MSRDIPSLEQNVLAIEKQLQQIKLKQFIGDQSILNYRTFSDQRYDFSKRIYQSDPVKFFRLTLIHDTSVDGALLRLSVYSRASFTGDEGMNVMQSPIPYKTPTAPPVQTRWRKETPLQGDRTSWIIRLSKGQFGIDYYDTYHKIFIEGSDTGTWTISEL